MVADTGDGVQGGPDVAGEGHKDLHHRGRMENKSLM